MEKEHIFLDVRVLESPLPLQKVLQAISENSSHTNIIVFLRLEPLGLYPHLNKLGYQYRCTKKDTDYLIEIWKKDAELD